MKLVVSEEHVAFDQCADRGSFVSCVVGGLDIAEYLAMSGLA